MSEKNIRQFGLGAKKDKKDRRDFRLCGITADVEIPKQVFSLTEKFNSNNQYSRGSCTSQAQAHHKERQEDVQLSARFIMALTKDYEKNIKYGAFTRNSFKIIQKYGSCKEELYPEAPPEMSWEEYIDKNKIPQECFKDAEKHKSKTHWRVDNTIEDIRQALFNAKNKEESVVISMRWYKEFNRKGLVDGKILPVNFKNYVGGHAVEVTGFDDFKGLLKVKNSWGVGWGDNGFFYMPYSVFPKVIMDCWTSRDYEKKLAVDVRYGKKFNWKAEWLMRFKNVWLHRKFIFKLKRHPLSISQRELNALVYGGWGYPEVFEGTVGDKWLFETKY